MQTLVIDNDRNMQLDNQLSTGGDPVAFEQDSLTWGFWDETWSEWTGGYASEADARAALKEYCEKYLG